MPEKIKDVSPPTGFQRLLWRAPIWLYRWGLGGLLRGRFLLLHHTGRKSGLPRQNVLEVVKHDEMVKHDESTGVYCVASGFGTKADWYRNISKTPAVKVQVGRKIWDATAVRLEPDASGQIMVDYAQRNPRAAKELMRVCGYRVDGSDKDYFVLGRDHIPFMALEPREGHASTDSIAEVSGG